MKTFKFSHYLATRDKKIYNESGIAINIVKDLAPLMGKETPPEPGTEHYLDYLDDLHHEHSNMAKVFEDLAKELDEAGHTDIAKIADWFHDEYKSHKFMIMYKMRVSGRGWPNWAIATNGLPDPTEQDYKDGEEAIKKVVNSGAVKPKQNIKSIN